MLCNVLGSWVNRQLSSAEGKERTCVRCPGQILWALQRQANTPQLADIIEPNNLTTKPLFDQYAYALLHFLRELMDDGTRFAGSGPTRAGNEICIHHAVRDRHERRRSLQRPPLEPILHSCPALKPISSEKKRIRRPLVGYRTHADAKV